MRIAELAPLWKRVPPQRYGGSELVVSLLTEELVKLKQRVTLFAAKGAITSAKLFEVLPKPLFSLVGKFSWEAIEPHSLVGLANAFARIGKAKFDLVHNHAGFEALPFASLFEVPTVTTLHTSMPPDWPVLAQAYRKQNFISISNAQRQLAPYLNYVGTVHHGIDTNKFVPNVKSPKDYFAFLGTISPEKGADAAVVLARKLGFKLIIAGEIRFPSFFRKYIKPYLGSKIRFIGEVNHRQKNKLLRDAKALLFPIRWQEAFGLVMVEALACGAPVIAFDRGAVKEILVHNRTGFIVSSIRNFAGAMKNVSTLSRHQCRQEAERRFDAKIMAQNYLRLFKKIINIKIKK